MVVLAWMPFENNTSGLLTSNFLVALDMTSGKLENFEPLLVLNSLKVLNLTDCDKLVSIRKLCRLPSLEKLILWKCSNLTHVCKTIKGLESLALLNLAGCEKLWKASRKALCTGGGIPEQPLFLLPRSLKFLSLAHCNLEYNNDLRLVCNGPLYGLSLKDNLFVFMPSNIDLNTLRVLNLDYCINLKAIVCLPSTLEELYTYECKSLEKVTFESTRFRLRKFVYRGCPKLSEVQGLFKLVAVEVIDEADLGHMKWIKAYEDHKVDLVSDEIPEGRILHIQMLHEYGIRSTYMQGIKDQSMLTNEYTSSSNFLSFRVSLHPEKHRIQGLRVSCLYRSSSVSEDNDRWPLFTIIRDITKSVAWIYNPLICCKPRVDEDTTWLSYWPIGDIFDVDDEITVYILVEEGVIVSGCAASLVYMDDGELEQEEKWEHNTMKTEEVIGGDLSEFALSSRVYYLCRRDFFKSATPDLIKGWFGDSTDYKGKFPYKVNLDTMAALILWQWKPV